MPKMRLTEELKQLLQTRATKLVDPADQKLAVMVCVRQLFDAIAGVVSRAVPSRDRPVLEKFRLLERPSYLVVAVGEAYKGLERDVIQWEAEGSGAFLGRAMYSTPLDYYVDILSEWPSLLDVPLSMICNVSFQGRQAWAQRQRSLVVYTKTDSVLHTVAEAYETASKAYADEKEARLEVYQRLIYGTRYFEDLLREWPEVQDIYDQRVAARAAMLPATLSQKDRLLFESDLEERSKEKAP